MKRLPKLAPGVTCASHLIVSAWVGTGAGSDSPHFERLLFDAWRRVPHKTFTAVFDAGYDAEHNHALARREMGLKSIIPPRIGRPTEKPPPSNSWRGRMRRLLRSKRSRRACGYTQRWQAETVVSMIKRNLGDELRGKTARSRKREMLLRVLTHDLMIIRRQSKGRDRAGHAAFDFRFKEDHFGVGGQHEVGFGVERTPEIEKFRMQCLGLPLVPSRG